MVHGVDKCVEETRCHVVDEVIVISCVLVLHQPLENLIFVHQVTWGEQDEREKEQLLFDRMGGENG